MTRNPWAWGLGATAVVLLLVFAGATRPVSNVMRWATLPIVQFFSSFGSQTANTDDRVKELEAQLAATVGHGHDHAKQRSLVARLLARLRRKSGHAYQGTITERTPYPFPCLCPHSQPLGPPLHGQGFPFGDAGGKSIRVVGIGLQHQRPVDVGVIRCETADRNVGR